VSDLQRAGMFARVNNSARRLEWRAPAKLASGSLKYKLAPPRSHRTSDSISTPHSRKSRSPKSRARSEGNGKGEVARAACLMRRDDASANDDRIIRPALSEEQEHIRTSPQSTEALVADHSLKIE